MSEKCFACDRPLGKNPRLVDTRDGQKVYVGSECAKLVDDAGDAGYQPPRGGPRLWPLAISEEEKRETVAALGQIMGKLRSICVPKTSKEWEQLAEDYAHELDKLERTLEEFKASYDHCMIDGRPDFEGFVKALRHEAHWEQQIKRGDKTGQLMTDVKQLLDLADHVERIGKVQAYIG